MKKKRLDKKLSLRKNTVSNLNMNEMRGGAVTPYCPDTYTDVPCFTWTFAPCSAESPPRCITNENSDPCC